jgi:hypothetical protein
MIIIHGMKTLPRLVEPALAERLRVMPAVELLPIEVKSGARPRLSDAMRLRSFRKEYGKKARAGLLLHTGGMLEWLAPDVLAAPWWRVL